MAAPAAAGGWVAVPVDGGSRYYLNLTTGETTWDPPAPPETIPVAVTASQASALSSGGSGEAGTPVAADRAAAAAAVSHTAAPAPAAAAAAAPAGSHVLEGWVSKSDKGGRSWKKRWVVANARTGLISWFADNPAFALATYRITEKAKGELPLRGVKVTTISSLDMKGTGCPDPVAIRITAPDRDLILGLPDVVTLSQWHAFVSAIAAAPAPGAATAGGAGAGATITAASPYASLRPREGIPPTPAVGYMMKAGESADTRCSMLPCRPITASPPHRTRSPRLAYLDAAVLCAGASRRDAHLSRERPDASCHRNRSRRP